jgi:hypothetical protein
MRQTVVVSIALLILACNNQERKVDNDNLNHIDISKLSDSISNHFQKICYLSLEFKKNYPIGDINEVIVVDTSIYILDRKTESIFIYGRSGVFINVIAKHGKGPGEFINIMDFKIYNKNLYALVNRSKLYKYDLNGKLISEIRFQGFYADEFQISKEGILFVSNYTNKKTIKDQYSLRLCSEDGEIINSFLPYGKEFYVVIMKPSNQSAILENSFSFILPYGDVIYKITKNKIMQNYLIISNYKTLTSRILIDKSISNQQMIFNLKNIFDLVTYIETQRFILLQYAVDKDRFTSVYSKKDNTTFTFDNSKFLISKHFNLFPEIVGKYEDSFIGVIPSFILTTIKNYGLTENYDKRLSDIIINTNELSNPILAFYYFK